MGIFIQKEEFGLKNIVKAGKNQGLEFFNWLLKNSCELSYFLQFWPILAQKSKN